MGPRRIFDGPARSSTRIVRTKFALLGRAAEAVFSVEEVQLFHVHPAVVFADAREKSENFGITNISRAASREEAAAIVIDQADSGRLARENGIAAVRNRLKCETRSCRCHLELFAEVV